MGHTANIRAKLLNAIDGFWSILQDQASLCLRILTEKAFEVVSFTSTNIYHQDIILSAWNGGENFTFEWEPFTPIFATATKSRHEFIEILKPFWVLFHVLEVRKFGGEGRLESTVEAVSWAFITIFAEVLKHLQVTRRELVITKALY